MDLINIQIYIFYMKKLILSLFLALVLSSCVKTIETVREVPVTVREYIQRVDTFTQHTTDSVYIHQKGDTVFSEKFRTVYRDKVKIQIQRDSVPYVVEVTKTDVRVEKEEIPVKVRDCIWWVGAIAITYAFIRAVLFVRKKVLHL